MLSSNILSQENAFTTEEKSIFDMGIEAELTEPESDAVEAFMKQRLDADKVAKIIKDGLKSFESFKAVEEFLASLEKEEVAPVGLIGEEEVSPGISPAETVEIEKKPEEVVSLGLPGEDVREKELAVSKGPEKGEETPAEVVTLGLPGEEEVEEKSDEEVTPEQKESILEQVKKEVVAVPSDKALRTVREERFIIQEIKEELIEDNY